MAEPARKPSDTDRDDEQRKRSNATEPKAAANQNRPPKEGDTVVPFKERSERRKFYDADQQQKRTGTRSDSVYRPSKEELARRRQRVGDQEYEWYDDATTASGAAAGATAANVNGAPGYETVSGDYQASQKDRLTAEQLRREEQTKTADRRTGSQKEQLKEQQKLQQQVEQEERRIQRQVKKQQQRIKQKVLKKAATLSTGPLSAKIRAKAVNRLSWWFIYPLWFFIQLPMAAMTLIFMALALGISNGLAEFIENSVTIWNAIFLIPFANATVDILSILMAVGMICWAFLMMLALVQIMVVAIMYKSAGVHPLGGSTFKYLALIFTIVGYAVPGLNFFPWILLWMFAVRLRPNE